MGGVSVTTTGTDATNYACSTDSTGHYSFNVTVGPTYTLTYSKAGWVTQTQDVVANAPKIKDVTLVPLGTISGVVSDTSGPIVGATVSAGGVTTTSGAGGTYSLTIAADTYTVDASALAYTAQSIPSVSVTDATNTPLPITLGGTIIKGRVTSDLAGNPPILGVLVSAKQGLSTIATVTTDVNGNYAMAVAAGTYTVKAEKAGYDTVSMSGIVAASNQIVVVDVPLMHHLGTWDLAVDFSTGSNPNGQWSYGHAGFQNGTTLTAPFTLYTAAQTFFSSNPATGWGAGIGTNTDKRDDNGHGWVWKNMTGAAVVSNWWYGSTSLPTWRIEPDAVSIGGGNAWDGFAPTVRWTSPDMRIVDINLTLKGQNIQGGGVPIYILKNRSVMATKDVNGFYGTPPDYTDRVGTSPISTFASTLIVNSNDTIDFLASTAYPWPSADISIVISRNTSIALCATINDLKAQPLNTQVMLMTPMTVTAAVSRYMADGSGNKAFYIESADRSQAIKLVGDVSTIVVPEGTKITFAGKVIADPDDASRNVIQIISINDQVAGTEIRPLGPSAKALGANPTLRDKFVRVWGKVTSRIPNTTGTPDEIAHWPYEYFAINDGSGDIKIKMRGQSTWMNDPVPTAVDVGHYIAVLGICRKEGTDNVVFPRGYGSGLSDIDDYWSNQNPQ